MNLELLGVEQHQLSRAPSSVVFPKVFAANTKNIWADMFTDVMYSVLRRQEVAKQWETAVTEFLLICKRKKVNPFPSEDSSLISRCVSLAAKQRKPIGQLLSSDKFLPQFKVGTYTQSVMLKGNSFSVNTVVQLKLRAGEKADKATIALALLDLGFSKKSDAFVKAITSTDFIRVYNSGGWRVEYEVGISFLPTTSTLSITKYKAWLLNKVWLPAIRSSRIFGRSLI